MLHYVIATYFGRADDGEPKAGRRRARRRGLSPSTELEDLPMTQGTRHVIEEAWRLLAASAE